jgi:Fe2+ or Zn2+ uptake regulation protein
MFKLIATFLGAKSNDDTMKLTRQQREIQDYLAQSVDRCDLERRERELSRRGYF